MIQRLVVKAIPLIEPVRDIANHFPSEIPQYFDQKRGRGYAIGIIISVNGDFFTFPEGLFDPVYRISHSEQLERVRSRRFDRS
jgi:hypothetical protein